MKKVLYDAVLKEKLSDLDSPVELCDEEGHVIARIVPVPDPAWYDLEPKMSAEEMGGAICQSRQALHDGRGPGLSGVPVIEVNTDSRIVRVEHVWRTPPPRRRD